MSENNIQKQLAKLRRNKKLLWLGVLFLVVTILWILVSIFATTKTSSISQELRELSKPFVPRLESKFFDEILSKRAFSDEELSYFPIFIINKDNFSNDEAKINIMLSPEEQEEILQEESLQLIEENGQSFADNAIETGTGIAEEPSETEEPIAEPPPVTSTNNPSETTPFIEFVKENY